MKVKAAVLAAVFAFSLSFAAAAISFYWYRTTMNEHFIQDGKNLTRTIIKEIDLSKIETYIETKETDADYERVLTEINELQENNELESLYVIKPVEDGFYYIFDSDDLKNGGHSKPGEFAEYDGDDRNNMERLESDDDTIPFVTKNEDEWLMTVLTPVKDETGAVVCYVCADISMFEVVRDRNAFMQVLAMALLLITVVFTLLVLFIIQKGIIKPVKKVVAAADDFIRSDIENIERENSSIARLDIHTKDEIQVLGSAFKEMEKGIYTYIDHLTQVTAEKERLGAELDVAKKIQESMLPGFPAFPMRREFKVFAAMEPARHVGGDFYDFFMTDEDHLAVAVGDVSGKGIPAALFMAISKLLLKNHVKNEASLEEAFNKANDQLCEGNEEEMFVTAWMGLLTISTGEFQYVNAGHNPPLLRRQGGEFEYLTGRGGFILAGMEGTRYKQKSLQLNEGDMIFLYTDGVTEANNEKNEMYGNDRLREVLNHNSSKELPEILRMIRADMDAFTQTAPQFDDITMLMLKIEGYSL